MRLLTNLGIGLFLVALLLACQISPTKKESGASSGIRTTKPSAPSHEAEKLLIEAENAVKAGVVTRSRRALIKINPRELNGQQLFKFRLLTIEYYMLIGKNRKVEQALAESDLEFLREVPLSSQIAFFSLYARHLEERGDIRIALRLLILADERLSAKVSTENHKQIIRMLEKIPGDILLQEARLAPDLYMRGWYDFGLLRHIEADYSRVSPKSLWSSKYPQHSANRYLRLIDLRQAEVITTVPVSNTNRMMRVSFLLPFSDSSLSPIAKAIMSGYKDMASEYGVDVEAFELDTADDSGITQLYNRAVSARSDLVIGPLRKGKVDELYTGISKPPITTIVLNDLPSRRSITNLYSYSFAFENNVNFAAQAAWDHQCRNVVILAQPESVLAERGVRTFQKSWNNFGGRIVRSETLTTDRRLTEWISDIMDVTTAEVEANKEVFRSSLLKLVRLGVPEKDINFLLYGKRGKDELVSLSPHPDAQLLVARGEINNITDRYYAQDPIWEINKPSRLLQSRLAELQEPQEDTYTLEEVEQVMVDFFNNAADSYERADIDCMFLAMDSIKASQVRPFLSFYLANDIPLFGSFLLYDRSFNRAEYSDLEGITYGELAGIIEERRGLEDNRVFSKRFYLLGKDIFLLDKSLPHFLEVAERKRDKEKIAFNYYVLGNGGLLYMEDNKIHIIARKASFSRGVPRTGTDSKLSVFQ